MNGGLFDVHQLERALPSIAIPDEAFEQLFAFFDSYQWHLDERPLRADNEINPDVLGYIFEKYINQRDDGRVLHSRRHHSLHLLERTILPDLEVAKSECAIAFDEGSQSWRLLVNDPDRYIPSALTLDAGASSSEQARNDAIAGGADASVEPSRGLPTENVGAR